MAQEEEDFSKLPITSRLEHKVSLIQFNFNLFVKLQHYTIHCSLKPI